MIILTRMIRFAVAIALLFSLALIPGRTAMAETDCQAPAGYDCPEGELELIPLTTDEWEQAYDRFYPEDEPPPDTGKSPDSSETPTDRTPQQQEAGPPPDTGTPPDTSGTPTDGTPQQQEADPPPDTGGGQNAANTGTVTALEAQLAAAAKKAMMQLATKLYTGIGSDPLAVDGDGARKAAYDTDGNVEVTIGTATLPPDSNGTPTDGALQQQEATAVDLTVDKDATVAALHGWTGKKYTASPDGGGTYEAVVYSNVGDPVTSVDDTDYTSYGWWLHKPAEGNWVASAFVVDVGNVPAASGIDALRGTATYMGGAAGKYALYSATGGTNDAGHFTARATLEADFNTDMVTGTINNFMGADGQSRDWSVALKKSGVGDTGQILGADGADGSDPMKTVWTIDGTAAPESGQWSGMLRDNGDDGIPRVATGTFHSGYSNTGRMVGAFGANAKSAPASTLRAE